MWLLEIVKALKKAGVEFAVAGGYAVSLHGAVRGTIDLDFVISLNEKNMHKLQDCLVSLGYRSKLPVTADEIHKFRKEYIEKRNLIAWSFYEASNPAHIIDIIITEDLRKLTSQNMSAYGEKIPVLSLKSLIQMKRRSNRPQDKEDVKALEMLE